VTTAAVADLLRELTPQVLGTLVRRYRQFDACEDAVQEALLAATLQWPAEGIPDNPRSWLVTVASRRLVDEWRSVSARQRREENAAALEPAGREPPSDADDTSPCCSCAATQRCPRPRSWLSSCARSAD
jgi:predicted RNA polymerase sigma factor